jgi:hypothetical protein
MRPVNAATRQERRDEYDEEGVQHEPASPALALPECPRHQRFFLSLVLPHQCQETVQLSLERRRLGRIATARDRARACSSASPDRACCVRILRTSLSVWGSASRIPCSSPRSSDTEMLGEALLEAVDPHGDGAEASGDALSGSSSERARWSWSRWKWMSRCSSSASFAQLREHLGAGHHDTSRPRASGSRGRTKFAEAGAFVKSRSRISDGVEATPR